MNTAAAATTALLKPAKETRMDLTVTYTHTYAGAAEPTTITPQIKTRRGVTIISGLAPLLADHLVQMDDHQRLHTLEVLRTSIITIADEADEDTPDGATQTYAFADYGRLATTYHATADLPVAVLLDLAARIRATL